jgi:glucose-1-phosphate thymidylyltransferase
MCTSPLPIYDEPVICCPPSTVVCGGDPRHPGNFAPEDVPRFQQFLNSRLRFKLNFRCVVQLRPEGPAQTFLVGKEFIGSSCRALVLGDNIFYGHDLVKCVQETGKRQRAHAYLSIRCKDPERHCVVEFDAEGKALSLEEKPKVPKSRYGAYLLQEKVF